MAPVQLLLEREHARLQAGGYWDCLATARELARLLLAGGRYPWIARVRAAETIDDQTYHAPLVPRAPGINRVWTTHYVCCCDGVAWEPVTGRPMPIGTYAVEMFGMPIRMEVFVAPDMLPEYLDRSISPRRRSSD